MPSRAQLLRWWPWFATAATLLVTVLALRIEGRIWFCDCNNIRVWISDARSSHTSQHLFDPYTLTHVEHGLILYWLLAWCLPRWQWPARFWLGTLIESLWEIIENTPWVIQRYRDATAALGYAGDSVVNSLGDILACMAGLLLAPPLGWRGTLALLVLMEVVLAYAIRDNLFLSVIMLLHDFEGLKAWQEAV
jgi:hypothetical protein